ncbi:hypothetical protein [Alicyclobacillus vulcanalis]|uniref:Uncharacterized protein n=1 Tax=Alicyclobacillus vulcanalis TaxID=252246 RepID=A0A1N7MR84_9BACL|nr:hypothetical protein [Alicyclobacillus vulcanalis]SIS88369.1 hypothetical protein SAMN05421799_10632 [Alicyclobacillus vulcanalis]
MGRIDQQLATYEFFGGYSTSLSASEKAGVNQITTSGALPQGAALLDVGTASEVVQVVNCIPSGGGQYVSTLASPTTYAHTSGCSVAPLSTSPSSVFPFVQTVVMGEPITAEDYQQPLLFILTPRSQERRQFAQEKLITYTITAVLTSVVPGTPSGDIGEVAINTFYGWMDQIADRIRTNKILQTASYPQGAAIKFGENFTVEETHERVEDAVWLVARFNIESVEQVHA